MTNEELNKEIAKISDYLANKYNLPSNEHCPVDNRAILWLKPDYVSVLIGAKNPEETFVEVKNYILKTKYGQQILNCLNLDEIKKEALIRRDWETALKNVKHGSELSGDIGYGFSNADICRLANIYKNSKKAMRDKIEGLLTDCNFHTECSDFRNGNFEKYC